jgi:hypothetical protein
VYRLAVQVFCFRILDDLAEIHHRDPGGDMADHAEVVRHKQIRQAELVLKLLEQVDDLRLHGNVERGNGSSATISFGCRASARAMPMRWRCPPENSCGVFTHLLCSVSRVFAGARMTRRVNFPNYRRR